MPRDSNGNYSLPAGNPVAAGEIVDADWANDTMNDIAEALNDSLSRSGDGGMQVALEFSDGTESAPGIAWANEPTTGFYRNDTGDMQVTVLGQKLVRWYDEKIWLWNDTNAEWREVVASNDITVSDEGDITISNDVNMTGDVTINNTDISEFVSGVPAPENHRYWRITVDEVQGGEGNGELRLNELKLWANGMPFVNGKRYAPGTEVTDLVQDITGVTPGAGALANLINGVDNVFGYSLPNAVSNGAYFTFDFGEGSEQRITSIQQVQYVADEDWISGMTVAYSDDGSNWTDVGTFTEIASVGAADTASDHYTLTEQVDTVEPDELVTYPEVTSGGGGSGGGWTPEVITGDTTLEAGKYYLLNTSSESRILLTLPASPSAGDRIGIQTYTADESPRVVLNGGKYRGAGEPAEGAIWIVYYDLSVSAPSFFNEPEVTVELLYVNSTIGWVNTFGKLTTYGA
jgi:hypothetical protein